MSSTFSKTDLRDGGHADAGWKECDEDADEANQRKPDGKTGVNLGRQRLLHETYRVTRATSAVDTRRPSKIAGRRQTLYIMMLAAKPNRAPGYRKLLEWIVTSSRAYRVPGGLQTQVRQMPPCAVRSYNRPARMQAGVWLKTRAILSECPQFEAQDKRTSI